MRGQNRNEIHSGGGRRLHALLRFAARVGQKENGPRDAERERGAEGHGRKRRVLVPRVGLVIGLLAVLKIDFYLQRFDSEDGSYRGSRHAHAEKNVTGG